jgi:hypothetical protein
MNKFEFIRGESRGIPFSLCVRAVECFLEDIYILFVTPRYYEDIYIVYLSIYFSRIIAESLYRVYTDEGCVKEEK